ncbi:MAG TPA: geranylgeranylglycerol-phosphate geranylgeranyltransferase [Saprospiraceae bacterium]|nr:geranylgeranylglycerol-phosphate geranylgeranyltransferase [Saprospiraceae bacterium]
MVSYLKILRPINLGIVALTHLFFYYFLITPSLEKAGVHPQLTDILFPLFILCTLCIVAAGNLINDILDLQTDKINKPQKTFINNDIPLPKAWIYYGVITILGFCLAIYIGLSIQKLELVFIYPLVTMLLYWYSKIFKHFPVIGNFFVAIFTGFVVWVLLICEPQLMSNNHVAIQNARTILIGFGIFSFFGNLIRELVKDVEDFEGDKIVGSKTFPVLYGIPKTKKLITGVILVMLLILMAWFRKSLHVSDFRANIYFVLFVMAPIGLSIFKLYKAENKKQFGAISRFYKMVLLSGLIYAFIFIQIIIHG